MSVGASFAANAPNTRMRMASTTKVYGFRRATRTSLFMYEASPKRFDGLAVHEQLRVIRAGRRSKLLDRLKRPNGMYISAFSHNSVSPYFSLNPSSVPRLSSRLLFRRDRLLASECHGVPYFWWHSS